MSKTTGVKVVIDRTAAIAKGIELLATTRLMVGVPAKKSQRKDDEGQPVNNAELAYIHTNGAPEAHIPPRPFILPALKDHKADLTKGLEQIATAAMDGKGPDKVLRLMNGLGLRAQGWIKLKLRSNIPPPLAMRTVMARINRRKSKAYRRKKIEAVQKNVAAGLPPQSGLFIALIDTAQLLNAISYVVRRVGRRK